MSDAAAVQAGLLQAVANPNRLRLLKGLHDGRSRRDLGGELPISESGVSNHLRTLTDADLVYRAEDGWRVTPLGAYFADNVLAPLDTVPEILTRIEAAEEEAREELMDVPLSDQELERAVTRRAWERIGDELAAELGVETPE